jgi:MFS family permease
MSSEKGAKANVQSKAFRLIILMGIVSFFGDVTYEGARSVTAPFLATFGVSALVVGFVSGVGEFLGYAARLLSGYFVDRTKRYWLLAFLGYGLILSIPLLAFANSWEIVALLIVLERLGKAIRSPAKDSIISFATKKVGRGWGFGIHEAIDQFGAVLGPLILFSALYMGGSFKSGFLILLLPTILCLAFLSLARSEHPTPESFEVEVESSNDGLPRTFWIYTVFVFMAIAGFVNFQILSYHFKVQAVLADALIPAIYAVAMGVDAVAALFIGKAYDKIGLKTLLLIPLLTISIPFFSFMQSLVAVLLGIVFWGIVMGMQETVMRAAIADLSPVAKRGSAYGIFNTVFGLGWFFAGVMVGFLYGLSFSHLFAYVLAFEFIAMVPLYFLLNQK